MTTMTPYTSGMVNSSASFPESPQARVFIGSFPVFLSFLSRYARACPLPAPCGKISRSMPPLYMILTSSWPTAKHD